MEHITQTNLPNGLVRLTPDKGWLLYDKKSHQTFTNAEVRPDDLPSWQAVADEA